MGVADDRQPGCDGCDRTVAVENLRTVSMPDGSSLACCPQCEPHARSAAKKLAELETNRDQCDGCTDTFPTTSLDDVVLTDGTVVTLCQSCRRDAPGSSGTDDSAEPAETTEIARRKNLCSQCHEWHSAELYRVTLIHDRTETLCESCKRAAEREGIVVDVQMRKTEARDILDVEEGASEREIRRAFLGRIKQAHPDRSTGSTDAFRLVKAAYDRLSD
ncbi:J domain-containing protein [Halovivax limisalsi]|uniref:J domain-containing protein n=1 Tax=Halovivax limisalsi TaxID=1453760 RepID=UPI001FFDE548|nr:J domain-containing protein [Halovivax limisalsi]